MALLGTSAREIRMANGNSVELLAQISHVSDKNLQGIEMGKILPSKWQLLQIAGLTGISEKQLLLAHQQQLIANGNEVGEPVSERTGKLIQEFQEWRDKKFNLKLLPLNNSLMKFIESIVYFEQRVEAFAYEKVLPDGMAQLVIDLDEPSAIVLGQHDIPQYLSLKENLNKIVVRFQPNGLYLLTGIPQNQLLNRVLDAEYIFGRTIVQLFENLAHCKNPNELGMLINRFFIAKALTQEIPMVETQVINFVVTNIKKPIAHLVQKAGYSAKHLVHLFKTYTGLTPKSFQQIHQFNASINEIALLPTHRLSTFDWSHSYFDQAHFSSKFKRFSGFTPTNYLKTGNTCPRMLILH